MTEADWLACSEPDDMLRFLSGRVGDRKLRLFACGCCRRIWDHIGDQCGRRSVEISENYSDGKATIDELEAAFMASDAALGTLAQQGKMAMWDAIDAARLTAHPEIRGLADGTATAAAMAGAEGGQDYWRMYDREKAQQSVLLRCIFRNPFRRVTIDHAWLRWNEGTIPRIAQTIYDDRRFTDMPILADALEEAGCTNGDVLEHCRSTGPHVRGCWVVDLVLGKE